MTSFFSTIPNPHDIITPIQGSPTFPEFLENKVNKYQPYIEDFCAIVQASETSSEILKYIRNPSIKMDTEKRIALLKIFRRCVSPVCDTEATKKIKKTPTEVFTTNYGHTFKDINYLKKQFNSPSPDIIYALSALLGEYDSRGEQGYILTDLFFTWFENAFPQLTIEGPRGAGQDIQLSNILPQFPYNFPCDFVIKKRFSGELLAVGFSRYDSTRGGSQSDDRTGGNSDKVSKAMNFSCETGITFKIIFLSDGPGLTHRDTWEESCRLDGSWSGNVRVTTLITAPDRITAEWLLSNS